MPHFFSNLSAQLRGNMFAARWQEISIYINNKWMRIGSESKQENSASYPQQNLSDFKGKGVRASTPSQPINDNFPRMKPQK